jgi:hypothetical protein
MKIIIIKNYIHLIVCLLAGLILLNFALITSFNYYMLGAGIAQSVFLTLDLYIKKTNV